MRLSIYQKILMLVLPILSFSILGVGYYSYTVARGEMINEIRSKMKGKAEEIAGEVNALLKDASVDLVTLSEITSIADYYNNVEFELRNEAEICRKSIERFMVDFSRRVKAYSEIAYID